MTAKILIVDDEADLRESIGYLMEQAGYDVEYAANGYEAIGAAHVVQPAVVLLDVMMPKENGYRVARNIREAQAAGLIPDTLRIVLLTARKLDHDPERERMFEEFAHPDMVVYKPFDMAELVDAVHRLAGADQGVPAT